MTSTTDPAYKIFKSEIASNISSILESHPSVQRAEVSVTSIEAGETFRRRRSSGSINVEFISICYILFSEQLDIKSVETSLIDLMVKTESIYGNSFVVDEPTVIQIEKQPKDDEIGLCTPFKYLQSYSYQT